MATQHRNQKAFDEDDATTNILNTGNATSHVPLFSKDMLSKIPPATATPVRLEQEASMILGAAVEIAKWPFLLLQCTSTSIDTFINAYLKNW
jgi:hypothetical protein